MPRGNIAPDLGLPIALDRAEPTPVHQQLYEQLRRAILDGRLASGTRLPSTRTLAQALGVSRTVTSSAYLELEANIDATLVARLARQRHVIVTPLDAYYLGPPDRSGLLLG